MWHGYGLRIHRRHIALVLLDLGRRYTCSLRMPDSDAIGTVGRAGNIAMARPRIPSLDRIAHSHYADVGRHKAVET